jgi:hypothetical protein
MFAEKQIVVIWGCKFITHYEVVTYFEVHCCVVEFSGMNLLVIQ